MKAFTKLPTPEEARRKFASVYSPGPLGTERVPLLRAARRVLAEEIRASADLPPFDRSTVDGYAVRAADTAGASTGTPVTLTIVGEVFMGEEVELHLGDRHAARIPTGGKLPPGADAVVMQEHAVRRDGTVSVERAVKAGENVVGRGEDVKTGDVVLRAGHRLRPQDLGVLASLGVPTPEVFISPRVALIVTGDELVAPGEPVRGSQIRDVNTYTLSGLLEEIGCTARQYGIVGDNMAMLSARAKEAHRSTDALMLSGGSSVGEKDVVADAIAALGEPGIVVHGIAIRPGRPTILAVANGKPVFGLPGNVVSAMVVFDQFVRPVLEGLAGLREGRRSGILTARLSARLQTRDREDHVRVALTERGGALWAVPLPGGSAILTSMVRADGMVVVPPDATLEEGAEVEVRLLA